MPKEISKTETESCLREILVEEGYTLDQPAGFLNFGPEIKATKDSEDWYIEVIGYDQSGLERIKDFYEAFFQAISRLNHQNCKHIILAMPAISRKLLPIRAKIYRVAWQRIANAFPELEIWLVDVESKKYTKTSWIFWLKPSID